VGKDQSWPPSEIRLSTKTRLKKKQGGLVHLTRGLGPRGITQQYAKWHRGTAGTRNTAWRPRRPAVWCVEAY
jgi:hypothetical protein